MNGHAKMKTRYSGRCKTFCGNGRVEESVYGRTRFVAFFMAWMDDLTTVIGVALSLWSSRHPGASMECGMFH